MMATAAPDPCHVTEPLLLLPTVQQYFGRFQAHRRLLSDVRRLEMFLRALLHSVRPGDVVLDIGAGTGVLAEYAARAGAAEVFVIEENRLMMRSAAERLRRLGLKTRFHFFGSRSNLLRTDLVPVPADVVISETIGTLGINEGIAATLADASRFLRAGGTIVPSQLIIRCALYVEPGSRDELNGLPHVRRIGCEMPTLISDWHDLLAIDFYSGSQLASMAQVSCRDAPIGTVGVCLAFVAQLAPGLMFSNWPATASDSWGLACFPLPKPYPCMDISMAFEDRSAAKPEMTASRSTCGDCEEVSWTIVQPLHGSASCEATIRLLGRDDPLRATPRCSGRAARAPYSDGPSSVLSFQRRHPDMSSHNFIDTSRCKGTRILQAEECSPGKAER